MGQKESFGASDWRRGIGAAALAVLTVAASMVLAGGTSGATPSSDWPSYLNNGSHTSYNAAATAIGPDQVAAVQQAWRWLDPKSAHGGNATFLASPTVVNGVIYIGDEDGRFYAISEATQSVLWTRYTGVSLKSTCGAPYGVTSTATVTTDPSTDALTVYMEGADGNLYAMDALTGQIVWKTRIYTPSTTQQDYYAWGSPLVANGHVYIGVSSLCDKPYIQGGLDSLDQTSGAVVATWNDLPIGELGGSVWSSPAVLPDGSIVVGTGNTDLALANPDWAESLVRLDGTTLAQEDAWQVPLGDTNPDSDFGGSPTAFSATVNGVVTPMVGACNKNGVYYALPQSDFHDGPVWSTRIAQPASGGECDSAAIWDGTNLIEGGGNTTTINGVTYDGSVQSLDPATGVPIWQTGIPGQVIGTPSEDGAGLVAAQVFRSTTSAFAIYLLNATTGAIVGTIPVNTGLFGQPVFAGNDLIVGGFQAFGITAYTVTTTGPPLAGVSPSALPVGTTRRIQLTGSGFSGSPTVAVSGFGISASSVDVVSPTTLDVSLQLQSGTATGPRDLTVVEPDGSANSCSACLTVGSKTTTTVSTSLNPSNYEQAVTLTAQVSNFVAGDTMAFTVGGATIAGCAAQPITASGGVDTASCTTSALPIGRRNVSATFSGDSNFLPSSALLNPQQVVALPPPGSVSATSTVPRKATVTWAAVNGATDYLVFKSLTSGGPYTSAGKVLASASPPTSRVETGLTPGQAYFFVVEAQAAGRSSAFSTEATVTTP